MSRLDWQVLPLVMISHFVDWQVQPFWTDAVRYLQWRNYVWWLPPRDVWPRLILALKLAMAIACFQFYKEAKESPHYSATMTLTMISIVALKLWVPVQGWSPGRWGWLLSWITNRRPDYRLWAVVNALLFYCGCGAVTALTLVHGALLSGVLYGLCTVVALWILICSALLWWWDNVLVAAAAAAAAALHPPPPPPVNQGPGPPKHAQKTL